VWDDRSICQYEPFQAKLITEWDTEYLSFKGHQIEYALGIYTDDYFHRRRFYGKSSPAFTGTDEEQIPSLIRLDVDPIYPIGHRSDGGSIFIKYTFEKKLWEKPNKSLMFELDSLLLQLKQKESRVHTKYPALSFTLEVKKVEAIFKSLGIR
jgi:hypothetical protein